MHPELADVIYRQREREQERQREFRRVALEREAGPMRAQRSTRWAELRTWWRSRQATAGTGAAPCCAPA